MKIYSPDNFFTKLIFSGSGKELSYIPSSLITTEVLKDDSSVGLIPVTDLIKNNSLYVSKKFGLSFEGILCNSYIYFNDPENVRDFTLAGDISSVEALLTKIIFKELYDTDVNLQLVAGEPEGKSNLIVAGDMNFFNGIYTEGISFAEEMLEVLNFPFVHYVFASQKEENIIQFEKEAEEYLSNFDSTVESKIEENIPPNARDYFLTNISSIIVNLDEQDLEGISQIIRLPYYYGLVKDIIEVKYV